MKTNNSYQALPAKRKELLAMIDRVVKRATAMSPKERFVTMVRAGIYTKSGKLSKQYDR